MIFTNKHLIIAMLVAPILAVIAWFGVDAMVGETPHAAQAGQSYPLVARSNCRYDSGQCDLSNEDFELRLRVVEQQGKHTLRVEASHPLEGVLVAISPAHQVEDPEPMQATDASQQTWTLTLPQIPGADARLKLVASAAGSQWYVDAATDFMAKAHP